ncbi:MAG TPA: LamG domain-containing protein [Gaiellaceae bacterium]|nr:LamG domain-containing protein [Gaiellaceae bacterium]
MARRLILALVATLAGLGAAGHLHHRAVAAAETYSVLVQADHPVGYWPLDDAPKSRVARAAAGGINGRYVDTRAVNGVSGLARTFDGRRSFIVIPNSPLWSKPMGAGLTVEFWMRPAVTTFPAEEGSGYVWIVGKGSPGNQEWGFRMYGSDNTESPPRANRIAFYAYKPAGGEGAGAYVQRPVVPGEWIYVVGELTPTGVRLFTDGVLRQGPPAPATLYANPAYNVTLEHGSAPVRVGTRNFHSFFEGSVDEVAIYSYLLSPSQIRAHYRAALRGNPAIAHG